MIILLVKYSVCGALIFQKLMTILMVALIQTLLPISG